MTSALKLRESTFHTTISWQVSSFSISRVLKDTIIEILKERMKRGVLERSQALYRNLWFLIKKKNGKYHLINII